MIDWPALKAMLLTAKRIGDSEKVAVNVMDLTDAVEEIERPRSGAAIKAALDAVVLRTRERDEARAEVERLEKRVGELESEVERLHGKVALAEGSERDALREVELLRAELDRPRYETLRQLADAVERNEQLNAEVERLREPPHDPVTCRVCQEHRRREADAVRRKGDQR
jgi:chromosome segregation ATPase